MRYRPEIDGLRAVAVLPVILFHAGFEAFSGGYVGVDVFFVISGYLITAIIRDDLREGRFSLLRFYERRARRILPALFVVMLACIPFAWLWMMPSEFQDFAQAIVAVNLFASNILFWLKSGYFEPAAELNPLLHTWSLAVEEQFYLVFPLLLLALARAGARVTIVVIAAGALASLAWAEYASLRFPVANFFLLSSRAWELAIGALLALSGRAPEHLPRPAAEAGAMLGLAMIAAAVIAFDAATPFPGLAALPPVLGTALVIACAGPRTLAGRLLALRPLVGIGLISYSAYLWHQPLFAFARIRLLGEVSPTLLLALALAALLLAWITWWLVERPWRTPARIGRRPLFAVAATLAVALVLAGLYGHLRIGLPERLAGEARRIVALQARPPDSWTSCNFLNRFRPLEDACVYNAAGRPRVHLWGDSHATVIAEALAAELGAAGAALVDFTHKGCTPGYGFAPANPHFRTCSAFNRRVLDFVEAGHAEGAVFVLFARWVTMIESEGFDNREGGRVATDPRGPVIEDAALAALPDRAAAMHEMWRRTLARLRAGGVRVVLVYPVPEAGWNVPERLAREAMFGHRRETPLSTSHAVIRARNAATDAVLDRLGGDGVLRVDPERLLCDTPLPGRCALVEEGASLYMDNHHLSRRGAERLSREIAAAMRAHGWLER